MLCISLLCDPYPKLKVDTIIASHHGYIVALQGAVTGTEIDSA